MKLCGRIKRDFPSFYYDELSPAARSAIEDHLNTCAACAAYFRKNREALELVKPDRYTASPGYNYTEEVLLSLEDKPAASLFRLRWLTPRYILKPVLVTASLLLLVALFNIPDRTGIERPSRIQVAEDKAAEAETLWQDIDALQELDENNIMDDSGSDEGEIINEQELLDDLEMLGLS